MTLMSRWYSVNSGELIFSSDYTSTNEEIIRATEHKAVMQYLHFINRDSEKLSNLLTIMQTVCTEYRLQLIANSFQCGKTSSSTNY